MTSNMLSVGDVRLHVDDTGEDDLPLIVCLHSLFLDSRMFDNLIDAVQGRYRVVRPDFRGQGRSDSDGTDFIDMDTCVSDIEAVFKAMSLGAAHLVVQSMGGDVGFRFAHRNPELVRSMVILGSSARNEPPDQLEEFRQWVNNVGEHGFVGETLDMTMAIMFGETTRSDPAKADVVAMWRDRIAAVPATLRPAMSGVIERGSVVTLLPEITAPALVVSGLEDLPRPPEWAAEVAANLANAELWRLPKIGHSPILEAPDVVLPRVLEFMDRVESLASDAEVGS
jgi:3-oxoadipate enol-lactonase